MKKTYRIKKDSEIDAIFKNKNVKGDSCFAIYQHTNPEGTHFRFALSIGRKYGKAVQRNLAKRRIRMIIHSLRERFGKDKMFVIVIKPNAATLTFTETKIQLEALFKKTKLMENNNE